MIRYAIEFWSQWEIWVILLILTAGSVSIFATLDYLGPGSAVLTAYAYGIVIGALLVKLSPKYEVTENY